MLQQWKQLYIYNGLLFRRYEDANGNEKWTQLVVSKSLQKEVLHSLHNGIAGGHLGEEKTLNEKWWMNFFRFSLPEQIHSDQGKQFES